MSFIVAGKELSSRFFLGTARYPSLKIMADAIKHADVDVITIALRRQAAHAQDSMQFWEMIKSLGCTLLPNTAGCQSAKEAIMIAEMARNVFDTHWIKLEITCDDYSLHPNAFELAIATEELIRQGFEVFPYTTDDLAVCERLVGLGCKVVMPWAAPIGSGRGVVNSSALKMLRQRLPNTTLIVDAGLGAPSHAAAAMELGFDGVLLNTAVALAAAPADMAKAFAKAVDAGRLAYESGLMQQREFATPSTPIVGKPFWHQTVSEHA
jgi:thiazole synthase